MNGKPLYRSMYLYSDDAIDYADSNNNSLRNYYGIRDIDNILIDIDKEKNTDDLTLRKCQSIVFQLEDAFELQEHNFIILLSLIQFLISLQVKNYHFK